MGRTLNFDSLDFVPIKLYLLETGLENVFRKKNNKTVLETVKQPRYKKLYEDIIKKYPYSLNEPLGEFLYNLKTLGDNFYSMFLNQYGDETFSKFRIKSHLDEIGIYIFVLNSEIVYVGKTINSLENRINYGYGNISPKNCYLDGQSTNCHLNAFITKNWFSISLFFYKMNVPEEIKRIEKKLIQKHKPAWNTQM